MVGNTAYFSGKGTTDNTLEMFAYDTTDGHFWQVTDLDSDGTSFPQQFHHVGGKIIFMANDGFGNGNTGFELWELDLESSRKY